MPAADNKPMPAAKLKKYMYIDASTITCPKLSNYITPLHATTTLATANKNANVYLLGHTMHNISAKLMASICITTT